MAGYGIFPEIEPDTLREMLFCLLYIQHGGSGLGLSYSDVLALDWSEAAWFAERLGDQRAREAKAIKDGNRRGR